MDTIPIYLNYDQEFKSFLIDEKIDLSEYLKSGIKDIKLDKDVLPRRARSEKYQTKDLLDVAYASAISIPVISYAISEVIQAVYSKPIQIEYTELEEIRDSSGEVVKNERNEIQFKEVKKYKLLEPKQAKKEMNIEVKSKLGFEFKISNKKE